MNKNSTVSTLSSVIADKDCADSAKHFTAIRFVDFETRVTTQINSSLHVYRSFHGFNKQKFVLKSVHLPSLYKQFVENKQRYKTTNPLNFTDSFLPQNIKMSVKFHNLASPPRVVKSSQLPAKIATYLVSISQPLCFALLYEWRFFE